MEEGLLPHKKTVEEAFDYSEERRLCYVGITRARDQLYLTRARNRIKYGKPVPRVRSRFMNEIPAGTIVLKDQSHGPDQSDSVEARQAHEAQVKDYLSGIRAMLEKNKSI
jgi:ATP-dependent exoDNAse (exonuclease V) beta subunit